MPICHYCKTEGNRKRIDHHMVCLRCGKNTQGLEILDMRQNHRDMILDIEGSTDSPETWGLI